MRREALIHNLQQHRILVFAAEGEGEQLLGDAHRKVLEHFCHVAVIAPRLLNPADPQDFSGLELGQRLVPTGVVIYTARPDDDIAYRAGWLQMGYVRHEDPLKKLLESIRQQGQRRQLRVEWPSPHIARQVADVLEVSPQSVTLDHLQDLLGRAFPRASALDLKPLPTLETASLAAATPVRRSVVLWAREHRPHTHTSFMPKVVKIGSRERIEREVQNYQDYVDGRLHQERQARLEGHALLWRLGAIAYAFLGASPGEMVPFRRYYAYNDPPHILDVLRRMFLEVCVTWYRDERETLPQAPLYPLYDQALTIGEHLGRLDTDQYRLRFHGVEDELPNPALWVLREGREASLPQVTLCVSHGDLHGDNFFVDQGNLTWLIDFEHTGPTHALRDFVELEADIKLRLTQYPTNDLPALAALERSLLSGQSLTGLLIPLPEVLKHPSLHKAFQVVAGLRHLACLATGVSSLQEYYHALLYETLFMATLRRLQEVVRRRALLSAALIVERMTRRTGLLSRQPLVPRIDTNLLAGQPAQRALALLNAQSKYLEVCHGTAQLLVQTLHNGAPPADLSQGMALLEEEMQRLQRLQGRIA